MDREKELQKLRDLLRDPRLRRRTQDALASGELERATEPGDDEMNTEQISLRLPSSLLERCDALAERLRVDPDLAAMGRVTRTMVIRLALQRGLDQLEKAQTPARDRKRRR